MNVGKNDVEEEKNCQRTVLNSQPIDRECDALPTEPRIHRPREQTNVNHFFDGTSIAPLETEISDILMGRPISRTY